jgi:hypothetical protein
MQVMNAYHKDQKQPQYILNFPINTQFFLQKFWFIWNVALAPIINVWTNTHAAFFH